MRNLKKLLALVLAMVMAFSLMLTASAVDYKDYGDKDSIPAEFVEAVKVLTGLKVMQGDEGGFRPGASITRAEAAAVIYRVATGDVEDKQVNIYSDYGRFTDVKKDDWFAGYVGYCQNAGYIKGTSPTTFNPYGNVTGYEVLAMILRVVGYGKNNEFTGSDWQVNVAALAKQLQVTKNVVNANFETTLNYAARRDVVADLVFQTMATVPTVTYTPALAYNDKQSIAGTTANWFNPTLGQKTFGLHPSTDWADIDEWGRPGYFWYSGGTWDGATVTGAGINAYVISAGHPVYTGGGAIATIDLEPSAQYDKQVHECDVASELKITSQYDFTRLYVNGSSSTNPTGAVQAVGSNYRIVATDTVTKVGGQGRITEFYYKQTSPWFNTVTSDVVMIDTMLAKVTAKTDAKLDPAGHVMVPARLEVTIWDGPNAGATEAANIVSKRIITKAATDSSNWEYNKGDFILLNAYTNKTARLTNEQKEAAAFETNKVVGNDTTNNVLTNKKVVWVKGVAESFQGKQTVTYWNQGKHQVDSKDYNDQLCLFLDKASTNTNTTYTWFLDELGNLIGIGDAKSTNYGVITSIYAAFGQGESDTTGKVKAVANVKYADGTTGQVTVDKFLMSCKEAAFSTTNPNTNIASNAGAANNATAGTQLTDSANTVELWPVYDTASNGAMTVGLIDPLPTSKPAEAANSAWLYLAPSASSNTQAHNFSTTNDTYGILYDHMFEFTTSSDNSVVAVEVAGEWNANASTNTGMYVDNANDAIAAGDEGKVFKNLAFLTLDNTTAATANADVWLNNDTKIIVRDGTTINTYEGVSALPGDITLPEETEVDWADVDGDGRADYLYVEGKIPGVVTYGLFYFNGGAAQWDGTKGTLAGYLNGEAATVTFDNYSRYTTVLNSNSYDAHLFALQITNGVVSDVMVKQYNGASYTNQLLAGYKAIDTVAPANYPTAGLYNISGEVLNFDDGTAANNQAANIGISKVGTWATDPKFLLGTANGNTYTYNTSAVYFRDSLRADVATNANDRHTNLEYVYESGGYKVKVSGYDFATGAAVAAGKQEFWIAPNAKIIGELEWLNTRENDVTIVFENNAANAIIEIYITPDPDITPVPGTGPVAPTNVATAAVLSSTVVGVANDTALSSALKSSAPNTVLFPTFVTNVSIGDMGDNTHLDVNGNPGNKLLFFPYSVSGNADTRLVIRNAKTGALVYAESAAVSNNGLDGTSTGAAHAFVINFTSAASNPSGTCYAMPMTAGYTYTFSITTTTPTGEITLSQGSFTMQ